AAPLHDSSGAVHGVMAVVAAIAERKKVEESARRLILEQAARAQAEAAQQRMSFLAEASRMLASSLEHEVTLERAGRLAVSCLADWCIIEVSGDELLPRWVAVACANPAHEALARDLERRCRSDPDRLRPLLAPQHAQQQAISDSVLADLSPDPAHRQDMRRLDFTSYLAIPLRAHERSLGAMLLLTAGASLHSGDIDV